MGFNRVHPFKCHNHAHYSTAEFKVRPQAVFHFCVLLFTFASMLCGIAWDLTSMVIFRIMQGIGGGALIPFPSDTQGNVSS